MDGAAIPWNAFVREFQRGHSAYVVEALEQSLLLPKDIDTMRKLKQQDLFLSLKKDIAMVSLQPHTFYLLSSSLFFFYIGLPHCFYTDHPGGLCGRGMGQGCWK